MTVKGFRHSGIVVKDMNKSMELNDVLQKIDDKHKWVAHLFPLVLAQLTGVLWVLLLCVNLFC